MSLLQIVILTIFILIVASYIQSFFRPHLRIIPGPILARLTSFYRFQITRNGHLPEHILALHEQYGQVVRIGPNHVSVSDPDILNTVYKSTKYLKSPFYDTFNFPYAGKLISTLFSTRDPSRHKILHSSVASRFSSNNIESFKPLISGCIDEFASAMRASGGQPVDLVQWLAFWVFDVSGAITLGKPWGFVREKRDVDGILEGMAMDTRYATYVGQTPSFHPWILLIPLVMRIARLLGIPSPTGKLLAPVIRQMEENRTSNELPEHTFHRYLEEKEKKNFDEVDMLSQLFVLNVAGGTTTAALASVFYCLLKHPATYKKLISEILGSDETSDVLQLPYLQAVLKEAMRLHAPSQIPLERIVPDEGLSISNTFLPPGTIVSTSAPLLHLNREIYGADAETFRPERWLEAKLNPSRLMDMEAAFFAFSRGNRGCTGRALAMLQMSMFVSRILRQFDIEWAEGTEQEWHVTHALLAEQSGIKARFIEQTRECENKALMDALMDDDDETNYSSSSA